MFQLCRSLSPRIGCSLLLILVLGGMEQLAAKTVELRDIAVTGSAGTSATITLLVTGRVETVVVERKGRQTAEVRMKSLRADAKALTSALLRPGMKSVRAHIERRDVLVADVIFTRPVVSIAVVRRDDESVVVKVTLGPAATGGTSDPTTASASTGSRDRRKRWALETIVIDAGHGGKDPGAIGIGGVREKDVTLAVARHLARAVRSGMPGVKVVMTRDADKFVELYRRSQIANQQNGRLFISIHCNSMPTQPNPASGFEIYILRPGRSDDAIRVAAAENESVRFESDGNRYKSSTNDAIVATMAQNAFARYSEEAANALGTAMRTGTSLNDRGVHQAGFYVLVGASMPAALVEIGYLSNEKDVKVLKSDAGQRSIARALYRGVRAFEKYYANSLR